MQSVAQTISRELRAKLRLFGDLLFNGSEDITKATEQLDRGSTVRERKHLKQTGKHLAASSQYDSIQTADMRHPAILYFYKPTSRPDAKLEDNTVATITAVLCLDVCSDSG